MSSAYAAALLGDAAEGKRLHDANCMGCHNTDIYARKERLVHSLDALEKQLVGCTHMAKADLSTNEMQDLLKYLNDQFYRFR
jgi:mono/diheme cytochrome c family protein